MRAPDRVVIERTGFRAMIEHCLKSAPREACGILAGRAERVERIIPVANIAEDPERRYWMDEAGQFEAFKAMRSDGCELVGIFHSHPATEAYPSATDLELAFYPEAAYVIVSLKDGAVARAFRIAQGEVAEIELVVE